MDGFNNTKYYFSPTTNNNLQSKGDFIPLTDTSSMYIPYSTADIILIDDDPIVRMTFINKIKKFKIKSSSIDEGRNVVYKTFSKSSEILKDIIENKSTYGLILMDENLGPDSFTGTQCIRRIRESNYNGAIVSISGSYTPSEILPKIRESGSNGLIPKSSCFFSEVCKLMNKLTTRDF
jgi:DNA-binding NarL/FixJ family response regulator